MDMDFLNDYKGDRVVIFLSFYDRNKDKILVTKDEDKKCWTLPTFNIDIEGYEDKLGDMIEKFTNFKIGVKPKEYNVISTKKFDGSIIKIIDVRPEGKISSHNINGKSKTIKLDDMPEKLMEMNEDHISNDLEEYMSKELKDYYFEEDENGDDDEIIEKTNGKVINIDDSGRTPIIIRGDCEIHIHMDGKDVSV